MVREIGFDTDDQIAYSKVTLAIFLAGATFLTVICWFGCKAAYDILINHTPITTKNQIIYFLTPPVFLASAYFVLRALDCLFSKSYIIRLSPTGLELTWPNSQTIPWADIKDIRVDVTTSRGVNFVHLVIEKHSNKMGWFQKAMSPRGLKIFGSLCKGGVDAAYEKVVAAYQRYQRASAAAAR